MIGGVQNKRGNKSLKKQRTWLGRVIRDMERKAVYIDDVLQEQLLKPRGFMIKDVLIKGSSLVFMSHRWSVYQKASFINDMNLEIRLA